VPLAESGVVLGISGNNVAYVVEENNQLSWFLYNGTTGKPQKMLTSDFSFGNSGQRVSGSNVYIEPKYWRSDERILLFNGRSNKLLEITSEQGSSIIGVDESNAFLLGRNGLFFYNGTTEKTTQLEGKSLFEGKDLKRIESSSVQKYSGSNTVLLAGEGLVFFNGTTEQFTRVTDKGSFGAISGTNVVWSQSSTPAAREKSLFLFDGKTGISTKLTDKFSSGAYIEGSKVVWLEFDGKDEDLFYYNSGGITTGSPKFDIEEAGVITGGSPEGSLLPGVSSTERRVNFKLVGENNPSSLNQQWNGKPVWIIAHGWNSSADEARIARLAQTTKNAVGDKGVVLKLDWREAANVGDSGATSLFVGDNATAATWITSAAKFAAQKLKQWGLTDGNQVNLIGHSLGSLLSTEIASQFTAVDTITALEPPSESNLLDLSIEILSTRKLFKEYDIDGSTEGVQRPKRFDAVSNFSRAFLGSRSIAGNAEFAGWADESFLVDYGVIGKGLIPPGEEHSSVIDTYTKLIDPTDNQRKLADDLFSLKDRKVHSEFSANSYAQISSTGREIGRVFEGFINTAEDQNVASLTAINAIQTTTFSPPQDKLIYGTNKNDSLQSLASGNDVLIGGNGNDDIVGYAGQDILIGGDGRDKLRGGIDQAVGSPQEAKDIFVFDIDFAKGFGSRKIGIDVIVDFAEGIDKILLARESKFSFQDFKGGSKGRPLRKRLFEEIKSNSKKTGQVIAGKSKAKVVFNQSTNQLFYNANGKMAGFGNKGGQFAVLQGSNDLSASDFLIL
jgi:pimeloyl-ACP methyl ester carboxylesterase